MPLHAETHQGQVEPIRGWVSPDYGLRVPAPQLSYTTVTELPLRVVSLLLPQASDEQDLPDVTLAHSDGRTSLIIDGGRETVRVDDRQVSVARAGGTSIVPLSPA